MKVELIILLLSLMTFATSMAQDDIILSCPDDNHPHAIDLGLPSGTKWACCNVGADKPEDYGDYYAWGETETKSTYNWSTYIHCDESSNTCHDLGSDIAGTEYDVAHIKWGNAWQTPSYEQIEELFDLHIESTIVNGINGWKINNIKGGANIFLPATGSYWDNKLYGINIDAYYWSSTQDTSSLDGVYFFLLSMTPNIGWGDGVRIRSIGQTIRPVWIP